MADPVEPVSLQQIKQHLDVVRSDQDDLLADMGVAAREWVENYTGLAFDGDATVQTFPSFTRLGSLLVWPEGDAATVTVGYFSKAGAAVTITTARLWRLTKPARVLPPAGSAWPTDADGPIAVTVSGVPYSLKAAILLMVGNLYANRESTVTGVSVGDTGAVENLCRAYRMPVIG